jgi:4-amino-4-deoxychorismate lyase
MPADASPQRMVCASPLPEYPQSYYDLGVRARLCRIRLASQPALAGIKHLNRLENVLARSEWSDAEIAEGLMRDADGNVVCGTMSNLFLANGGALATPDLARCGVAGVQRERVMEFARNNDIPVRIASVSIDELLVAEELFLVNSVIGVWPIAALDGKTWNAGPITTRVRHWLDHEQER